jgi:Leucine-rich repeat (LRR) protein
MKIFGLIALMLALTVGAWWVGKGPATYPDQQETTSEKGDQQSPSMVPAPVDEPATTEESIIENIKDTVESVSVGSIEVYDGISVPDNVRMLDLSGRGLTGSLKAEIRHLSQLEVLDLSGNDFTGLPAEVGQLSHLQQLDLSNNPLTGLPYELGNLQNLRTLNLSGTNYSTADLEVIRKSLPASTKVIVE